MKQPFVINPPGYKPPPVDASEASIRRVEAMNRHEEIRMRRELREAGLSDEEIREAMS